MKKEKIILIGAGGHALSVLSSLRNYQKVVGFIDENKTGIYSNIPIIGKDIVEIPNYRKFKYFISIGDVFARKKWHQKIKFLNLEMTNIIDESAIVEKVLKIGKGNFIGKQVIINAGCYIGDNNLINSKALLEHECIVFDGTNISTNAVLNGDVIVKNCAYVGSSSVVNGQLSIGENAIVGSGAVVTKNVMNNQTVVGIPAKPLVRS